MWKADVINGCMDTVYLLDTEKDFHKLPINRLLYYLQTGDHTRIERKMIRLDEGLSERLRDTYSVWGPIK